MKKIIYHGSKDIIEKPMFGFGNKHNDYGVGFYCTEIEELAKEWAVDINRDGYVNEYELNLKGLKILYLKKYNILYWLAILLENRTFVTLSPLSIEAKQYIINNFHIDYRSYDIIIGYRADDSYFTFAKDFINGVISYQQLGKAIKLGNLGEQIVLISERSFKQLRFINSTLVEKDIYLKSKLERDEKARKEYFNSRNIKRNKGDLYITQIIDEGIKENDSRL